VTAAAGVEQGRIVQPLLDAGVSLEELKSMLFDVAFAGMVGGPELDASLRDVVAGRPVAVRAAWVETVSRMLTAAGR